MHSKDFTIGLLSTTAAILIVGLALVQSNSGRALADGMTTSTSSGNLTLAVGALDKGDDELVYLIDAATDRMLVYRFDTSRRLLEVVQGIDLGEVRKATSPPAPQKP
jgi:hypothetical protein